MPTNSIGGFQFTELFNQESADGSPGVTRMSTSVVQRPGVNGAGVFLQGFHGNPFQMIAARDYLSESAVTNAWSDYLALIPAGPVKIIWRDINYFNRGVLYHVRGVDLVSSITLATSSTGGFHGTSAANYATFRFMLHPTVRTITKNKGLS